MLAKSKHSLSLNFLSTNTNKSAPAFFSTGIRRLWVLFEHCLRVVISTLKFLAQISGNLSAECWVLFVIHQIWDLSVSGVGSAEWELSGRPNPGPCTVNSLNCLRTSFIRYYDITFVLSNKRSLYICSSICLHYKILRTIYRYSNHKKAMLTHPNVDHMKIYKDNIM